MVRPGDRCEYDHKVADYFKPYCCFRESWREGRCVWHAPVRGKPAKLLNKGRVRLGWGFPEDGRDEWIGHRGERLDRAFLKEADLRTVPLDECTLVGGKLSGANLTGGDLSNSDLREADLSDVEAAQCQMENAVLEKTDLSGANLEGANLRGATLNKADLSGANLREADLSGADLRRANLEGASLQGADLPGTRLYGADLTEAELINVDLTGSVLRSATLVDAYGMNSDFESVSLKKADLTGADLRNATLVDATLREATVRNAHLGEATLEHADATDATFDGSLLERAHFDHVDCYGASFVGARIYGATFAGTAINEQTEFGEFVRYDPRYEGNGADPDSFGDIDGDAEDDDADDPEGTREVDQLTKAAGSYRKLSGLAAANEFPDRRDEFSLRRKQIRRRQYGEDGQRGRWLRATLANLVTGYGERPGRVLATATLVVVGCGLLYPLGWIREGEEYVLYGSDSPISAVGDGLYFSLRTFTFGGTEFQAAGPGRILAGIEGVAGIVFLALLAYVLTRRGTR